MAHHSHAELNPQITNQLDIGERLGLVLLANFSLNIIGSHVLTRTAVRTRFYVFTNRDPQWTGPTLGI